jgi:hypothetical protein
MRVFASTASRGGPDLLLGPTGKLPGTFTDAGDIGGEDGHRQWHGGLLPPQTAASDTGLSNTGGCR